MFEQTLLTQPASAQKTGAFAISLTAQMCVFGVLIVGPLIYTQTLTLLPPKLGIELRVSPPPPPVPPPVTQTPTSTTSTSTLGLSARPSFVPRPVMGSRVFTDAAPVALADIDAGDFVGDIAAVTVGGPVANAHSTVPYSEPIPTKAPTVATAAVEPPAAPIKLNTGVLASKLVIKITPQYPPIARTTRVSGSVRLLAVVGTDGHVKSLRVLEGHALLRKAAEDAVWQWVYSPTYLSGRAVEVEAAIEVNFALN